MAGTPISSVASGLEYIASVHSVQLTSQLIPFLAIQSAALASCTYFTAGLLLAEIPLCHLPFRLCAYPFLILGCSLLCVFLLSSLFLSTAEPLISAIFQPPTGPTPGPNRLIPCPSIRDLPGRGPAKPGDSTGNPICTSY